MQDREDINFSPALGMGQMERSLIRSPIPSAERVTVFPWNASIASKSGVYGFNSNDARARSFNLIRAKLVALRRERGWRMFGIVSATPDVGKSFVAASLSAAMSRDPRFSTTLVDLDLRRGTVGQIFGAAPEFGISHYLESTAPGSVVSAFRPQGERLVIMPTVPSSLHSAELLANARSIDLLEAMRATDEKNLYFLDLPPVYANDDAATILESLDGYLFVVQDGKTTQQEVVSAIDMLGRKRLAGVILNKYRGGLISEGRGIEQRYATDYYTQEEMEDSVGEN